MRLLFTTRAMLGGVWGLEECLQRILPLVVHSSHLHRAKICKLADLQCSLNHEGASAVQSMRQTQPVSWLALGQPVFPSKLRLLLMQCEQKYLKIILHFSGYISSLTLTSDWKLTETEKKLPSQHELHFQGVYVYASMYAFTFENKNTH